MPTWNRTVDIKPLLDGSVSADVVAQRIRGRLIGAFPTPDPELGDILTDFESVGSVEECDAILDRLYDWADARRIWLGPGKRGDVFDGI